jgi:hypothetical protein
MAKKLKLKMDIVPTEIVFIIGKERHDKYIRKMQIGDQYKMTSDAITTSMNHLKKGHRIIIGIEPQTYCVYQVKGLIIHEIAHAVDFIMEEHGFEGMEFRAYTQQYLYIEIIKYYDKHAL